MTYSLFALQRGGTCGFVRNRRGGAAGSEGDCRPLDQDHPARGTGGATLCEILDAVIH